MAFNVRLNSPCFSYLEKEVIQEFANLQVHSIDNEIVSLNPYMLAALNSNVILTMDNSMDYNIWTEFSVEELQALNEFLCTGNCEMSLISEVFQSFGIDVNNLWPVYDNAVVIKEEIMGK